MEIKLDIRNLENFNPSRDFARYEEIFAALIQSGGLDGVKGGKTVIHFDGEGVFMGVQLDYWPYKRRK